MEGLKVGNRYRNSFVQCVHPFDKYVLVLPFCVDTVLGTG